MKPVYEVWSVNKATGKRLSCYSEQSTLAGAVEVRTELARTQSRLIVYEIFRVTGRQKVEPGEAL